MNKREVVQKLREKGATHVGGKRHERWVSALGECKTSVPRHNGDLPKGTIHAIEKDMAPCFGEGWLTRT